MKTMPICKAETPMVFFFRLGSLPVSKSQLMNTLINDRHSTFFHRNCPGSTKSRLLMDGVAEIACYDDKWTELKALKKKHNKSDLLTSKQTELEEISKKLQSATFGLEHIFREMGQIYEAHRAVQAESRAVKPKHTNTDWSKYPELAADLMISGHPVELMDGDAGHVPLTWISGFLDEVIKKLGDQRVFVLSVLGLQSSGKSTMLNAMFGLQFAVSAGRCTKGAFMQLVKVSEEIKKDFQFDYFLVVDTEGLRALELAGNSTRHHDNALATFVVGLGSLTLINIFGENPADMQDVLQIVVQAFMRMKKVKLSPSCVFKQSLDAIMSKPVATRGYSSTYLQEVAKTVQDTVTEFESNKKCAFKKEFTVDLLLYVFDTACSWLSQSHKKYKTSNDALTYLESKKTEYYNIFSSFCKGNSSAVVFGEMICGKLKVSIVEAVCNKVAIDLAGEMRCTFPAFNGNRLNLEKHVLKSLAEKEDFDAFITYIRNPRKQVEAFIKEKVNTHMLGEHKDKTLSILRKNEEDINKLVIHALNVTTKKVKTQRGDTDMWEKEFSSLLSDKLTLDAISIQNFKDIKNFDFLQETIEKGLVSITKMKSQLSLDKMKEFRLRPDQILIDQLCNCCWETCPFCAAVCTNTIKDHSPEDHSVPFHRSQAINGWHYRNTEILCVDFCTTQVASEGSFYPCHDSNHTIPFKKYRTAGPPYENWSITPDESKL
ncbi:interferon-induced very large GTPase 1-like, partial [Pundamilia nyererei]|uniref:Interferon-induced very large GTPase 1-like n=1 Tax=Pundamilia nyererei TaxID=303518 RepID=A0A9Y3VY52_9CICH